MTRMPRLWHALTRLVEGVVAAEERVDVVERVGVVAVARRRREERREVQPAHAERGDVVEVGLDAGQVAAVAAGARRVRPSVSTGSSHAATVAHGRPLPRRAERAKRSGKIW